MLTHSSDQRVHVVLHLLLCGYSKASSFSAKMKTLAEKISQIVSHFAKHPMRDTGFGVHAEELTDSHLL